MENIQEIVISSCNRDNKKYVTVESRNSDQEINLQNIVVKINCLKDHFKVEKINNELVNLDVTEDVILWLEKYLMYIFKSESELSESIQLFLTELYRSLRNCSTNSRIQSFIAFDTRILSLTLIAICCREKFNFCIKIILQFLINLITSNKLVIQKVYDEFFNSFIEFIQEDVYTYECCALIYNISLVIPVELNTIETMFKLCGKPNQNEFSLFFVEHCISSNDFWNLYNTLNILDKLIILEKIRMDQIEGKVIHLPDIGLQTITNHFLKSPDIFFKITSGIAYEQVQEVSSLLEIISALSSSDDCIKKLQENKNILVVAAALLINFHKLGKEENNIFTPIQKLSDSKSNESNNPVFGIKADLIRLIGNMCWKNAAMQNLARETEIIPVILDCCNIDVKNPFIIQWCIFAIRNLCENNLENQNLISGLHQQGTVPSQVLDEFGITLHNEGDNQLKIVSLESLKK